MQKRAIAIIAVLDSALEQVVVGGMDVGDAEHPLGASGPKRFLPLACRASTQGPVSSVTHDSLP